VLLDFLSRVIRKILRPSLDWLSVPTVVATAVAISEIVASFNDLPKKIFTWGAFWPRTSSVMFDGFVVCFLLLGLYGVNATVVAADWISGIMQDNQNMKASSNYGEQLARAVGVRFHLVLHSFEIMNFEGDTKFLQEEEFEVFGIALQDLVRRLHCSNSAMLRTDPIIQVLELPPHVLARKPKFDDSGGTRKFHIYFDPALERTLKPARLLINEEVKQGFYMTREQVEKAGDSAVDDKCEFVGHTVSEPTLTLTLVVDFPLGYRMDHADVCFRVNYGESTTRHLEEEKRVHNSQGFCFGARGAGTRYIRLEVTQPIPGLCYTLRWRPMIAAELDQVAKALTAEKK
jgi:hypothetical protein